MIECGIDYKTNVCSDRADTALKAAIKYVPVLIGEIPVMESELEVIKSIKRPPLKRLAFALLCFAKYWDVAVPGNTHWVHSPDSEIMKAANIKTSLRRQGELYHAMQELGLLTFSKRVDGVSMRVNYIDASGDKVISVHDLRNLGYQYLKHYGGRYIECRNCGITTKITGQNQKYCPECSIKIHTRQKVESVMRSRKNVEKSRC